MSNVNRGLLSFLVGAALAVPVTFIGEALDFGGLAWLAALVALMFVASLVDREGFYGEPHPFSRRARSR